MKIIILGGGMAGLAAAWDLCRGGHDVTVIEKEAQLGGLAGGFQERGWDWSLERAYHHIFSNDREILDFAEDMGFKDILLRAPKTVSLYKTAPNNYRTFPVDTPQDFLKFPLLSFIDKIRAGLVVVFLKLSPFLSFYESVTAETFLRKTMGENVWKVMWREMFRKKFGKYAGKIIASFFWARVKKRSKTLGYFKGGFQGFIDYAGAANEKQGVEILKNTAVLSIGKKGSVFEVTLGNGKIMQCDIVISTLPTPILLKIATKLLPGDYARNLGKIKYLHAVNLILESDKPFLGDDYWVSVCDPDAPMMVLVQHTNFMDKSHYGNRHILYAANYVEFTHPLIKATDKQVLETYLPYINRIAREKNTRILRSHVFKAPFAQPLYDREFPSIMPRAKTPVENLYMANLDMTYPYDRGTNYAVKLGREVASLILRG